MFGRHDGMKATAGKSNRQQSTTWLLVVWRHGAPWSLVNGTFTSTGNEEHGVPWSTVKDYGHHFWMERGEYWA
jgi:hypothetical protein